MHDGKQILHRDLKPGNIFLAKNDIVKIGDLGSAKELSSAFTNFNEPNQGTKAYMAPERFQDPPKYGYPSDIFALGTIAYELFTLQPAFILTDVDFLQKISTADYDQ